MWTIAPRVLKSIQFLEKSSIILKEKESICDKLVGELEELLIESLNETSNLSNDLLQLNEIRNNKIQYLTDEHCRLNSNISVSKNICKHIVRKLTDDKTISLLIVSLLVYAY